MIKALYQVPAGGHVAVFTHGQVIQAWRMSVLLPELTNAEKMTRFQTFSSEFPIANAAVLPAWIA